MVTETIPTRSPPLFDIALLMLLATLWAGSYAFMKLAVETIPPMTVVTLRMLIAGLVLLPIVMLKGFQLPLDIASLGRFAVLALVNSLVPFVLIAWAQQTVPSALATVLSSTAPIFACLLALLPGMGGRMGMQKLLGVIAGFAGVVLIIGPAAMAGLGQDLLAQGALLAAGFVFALSAFVGTAFPGRHPLIPATGALLVGAVLLAPFALIFEAPWTMQPSLSSILGLTGMALFSTALGFVLYFRILATLGVAGGTAQAYLRVPIGAAFGVIFFGEVLASSAWMGIAAVACGVALMTMPPRRGLELSKPPLSNR
ncbi:DMT family transporter [Acetobacteraceae bacterium H6797]|nr:DMT family transporter [Acetobacteraceae bacterium H6797]